MRFNNKTIVMIRQKTFIIFFVLFAFANCSDISLCFAEGPYVEVRPKELFKDIDYDDELCAREQKEKQNQAFIRSRYVQVNYRHLVGSDCPEGNEKIILNLFDGISFTVVKERVVKKSEDSYCWFGKVEYGPLSNVVLTVGNQIMFGRVEYMGSVYKIGPVGDGSFHRIIQVDLTKAVPFGDDALVPPLQDSRQSATPQNNLSEAPLASLDDGSEIDIMVLYTDGIADVYPGDQIITKIDYFVDITNQAFTNSEVDTMLNVVKTQQVSYADSGPLVKPINAMTDGSGVFSNVSSLRDQFGADLVVLLREYSSTNDSCGLAWKMQSVVPSFADLGFSVVQVGSYNVGSTTIYCPDYTFSHEVGHNMGNSHDRDHTSSSGAFSYSYGHDEPGAFATIMSYDEYGIGYYSNPDISYSGLSIGVEEGQSDSADNAKSMGKTKATVAQFRNSIASPPSLDIQANGSGNTIVLGASDILSITVSLSAEDYAGVSCDWWVAESAPDGWYYYSLGTAWTFAGSSYTDLSPTYQGDLVDLGTYSVLNPSGLSEGTHTFYFAIDTNKNGTLDFDELYSDSVSVDVTSD